MRSISTSFDAYKDVLFLLDEARRFFVELPASSSPRRIGSAANMLQTEEEALKARSKQNPWMVAGASQDLHYITAVCYRALALWLDMSTDSERSLFSEEVQQRASIDRDEVFEWKELQKGFQVTAQQILFNERVAFHCLRMHGSELDARSLIEESYAERVQSIYEDLRRLHWHADRQYRIASAAVSRGTTPAPLSAAEAPRLGSRPATAHDADQLASAAAVPRFYFLETLQVDTIDSIEIECRQETARQERYAFSALREIWNMDFQWLQELMAEQKREELLRQEFIVEQKRKAYEERVAEIARLQKRSTSTGTQSVMSFSPNESSRVTTSLGGRASQVLSDQALQYGVGYGSVPVSRSVTAAHQRGIGENGFPTLSGALSPSLPLGGDDRQLTSRYDTGVLPVEFAHYRYGNPHATAPSSLGFGSHAPQVIYPTSITNPVVYLHHAHRGDVSAHRATNNQNVVSSSIPHRSKQIVVTARVVSPDYPEYGSDDNARREEFFARSASPAGHQRPQHLQAIFDGMLQDFLDDQEIERSLVEDEEQVARKECQRQLREGRMVEFDWSMGGYRRLINSYSSANASRLQSRNGTSSSALGGGATYGMRVASVMREGASSRSGPVQFIPQQEYLLQQHHGYNGSRAMQYQGQASCGADAVVGGHDRHLPEFMRGSNASRVSYSRSGPEALPLSNNLRSQGSVASDYYYQQTVMPRPPSSAFGQGDYGYEQESYRGIQCPPVTGARPASSLVADVLRSTANPVAKYGYGGASQPDPMFLPRTSPSPKYGAGTPTLFTHRAMPSAGGIGVASFVPKAPSAPYPTHNPRHTF
jgi:hypothetical protein